jgi:hypothetical protein
MAELLGTKDFKKSAEFLWPQGGGINSRASARDIEDHECAAGTNFTLDLDNLEWRNRNAFDLVGTAPNGLRINGFAQLWKPDGTTSTLVQAGPTVYSVTAAVGSRWTFTSVGTVSANARLRGDPYRSNWMLGPVVLIADLASVQPVMQWDGTTLSAVVFNGVTGNFLAKYIWVDLDRAVYANVISNAVPTPHMLVGSKVSDYTTLSILNVPSTALGTGDPWYMLQPDLKPINGIVGGFGRVVTSSFHGDSFQITGTDSTNFAMTSLYPQSGSDSQEGVVYIGNDIAIARPGRIGTLFGTLNFGNVATFDLTRKVQDQTLELSNWTLVYNRRYQRLYAFPGFQSATPQPGVSTSSLYVLFKTIQDDERMTRFFASGDFGRLFSPGKEKTSAWGKWVTTHAFAMQPTAAMTFYSPLDGLEHTYLGDSAGNVYQLEGDGWLDGGTAQVYSSRLSKAFFLPDGVETFNYDCYVEYRIGSSGTLGIDFQGQGQSVATNSVVLTLPAARGGFFYSGPNYYNGAVYYSGATGQLIRQYFEAASKSNLLQLSATLAGQSQCAITHVSVRLKAAT